MLFHKRNRRTRPNARKDRPRRMLMESLEARMVMTCGTGFEDLAQLFQNGLSTFADPLHAFRESENLPLIGDQFAGMSNPVDQVSAALSDAFQTITELVEDQDPANVGVFIEQTIASALSSVGITPTELDATCEAGGLNVSLDVSRDVPLIEPASFEIGIGPLPFFAVNADAHFDVGVSLSGLDMNFGVNEAGPYVNAGDDGGQFQVSLYADFTDSSFEAMIGLLGGEVSVEPQSGYTHPLEVTLTIDPSNAAQPVSVDGGAHFNLVLEAGANESLIEGLPKVGATIVVDWFGPHEGQAEPTVKFEGVQIEFGGVISSVLAPIVEYAGPIIDKVDRIFEVLNAPLPVLKDLVDPDPTTMDLLEITSEISESRQYQAIVDLLQVSSMISGILDTFETQDGQVVMDLGEFDLSGASDLRSFDTSTLDDLANLSIPELGINPLGTTMDLDALSTWAQENLPGDLGKSVGVLLDRLDGPVEIKLPLLTDPSGSVFSLLLGQDVDLFRVDVDLDSSGGYDPEIPLPGLSFNLGSEINWDVTLGMGLDTRGIRNFIQGVADGSLGNYHFGDGFYITEDSSITLEAGLTAELSANLVLVHAAVEGGVLGTLQVVPEAGEDWKGTDAPDDKLYIRTDMGDCLGRASGGISAFLDAWVGIGAKIPGTDIFLGGKKEFHLAKAELFSFGNQCLPNPFASFDGEAFEPATTHENQTPADLDAIQPGELWLNVGHRAYLRGFHTDIEDESILVEQVDVDGVPMIRVTFDGRSKDYEGIDRIVAYGGTGADYLVIAEGVTVDVFLDGGEGDDVLISHTTGESELYGGNADDVLEGGLGFNMMDGGAGNDQLNGGPGTNLMIGGADDDLLLGGPASDEIYGDYPGGVVVGGADTIYAGGGSDLVFGGGGNDTIFGAGGDQAEVAGADGQNEIYGDGGDDTIFAGTEGDVIFGGEGNDQIHAGSGNDLIATYAEGNPNEVGTRNYVYWEAGDGASTILNSRYSIDTVSLFGSSSSDTFVARDGAPLPPNEFEIAVDAPGAKTVTSTNISYLNIDGLDGEDTVWLHAIAYKPASPHPLEKIGVNLAEEFRDDGDEDHVYVLGTDGEDALVVDSEQVLFTDESVCNVENQTACRWGGVMTVTGLPDYKIYATNVMDDLQVLTGEGSDNITIQGNTGPTLIETADGDDVLLITASTLGHPTPPHVPPIEADFLDELTIDAGAGQNALRVYESYSEISDEIHVEADSVSSDLLPQVHYRATGGKFSKLEVAGGPLYDEVYVHSTHADVGVTEVTGFYQPGYPGIASADQIFVSSTGEIDGHLGEIHNRLVITGHSDNETLVHLGDRGATSGNALVSVSTNEITGFAGGSDEAVVQMGTGLLQFHLYGSDEATLAETFYLDSPDHSVVLHGGQGDESVVVQSLQQPAIVIGEDGDDITTVPNLDDLSAKLDFWGYAGRDFLIVHDLAAPAGSVYELSEAAIQRGGLQVSFDTTVEQIELATSDLDDSMLVNNLPTATVEIDQNGGSNTLYGPNSRNVWEVSGNGSGTLNQSVLFRNADSLVGGDDDDRFRISAGAVVSGEVIGGGAVDADTLDYSQHAGRVTFSVADASGQGKATGIGGFGDIETLIGGSNAGDRLIGFQGDLIWEITGADTGLLHGDSIPIEFLSVELLVGAGGNDRFVVHEGGSISGQVHGGAGQDTLDYSPSTSNIVVNLPARTASRIAVVRSIEDAAGGSGDDVLIGDNLANRLHGRDGNDILIGNGGNDLLMGGAGRDLLIGGAGQDEIHGQQGEDILIGGTTIYDGDVVSLGAIRWEWTRQDLSYQQRVDHLMHGGGYNGGVVLNRKTVLDDGAVDRLFGENDRDWFWHDPADLLDAVPGELTEIAGL